MNSNFANDFTETKPVKLPMSTISLQLATLSIPLTELDQSAILRRWLRPLVVASYISQTPLLLQTRDLPLPAELPQFQELRWSLQFLLQLEFQSQEILGSFTAKRSTNGSKITAQELLLLKLVSTSCPSFLTPANNY